MAIPIKLSINPVLDISSTLIRFVPNMMAFGGVAAGIIKANEADIVAGSMNNKGLSSRLIARPAKTGKKVSTVATFEVSSVKKVISNDTDSTIIIGWTPLSHMS